MHQSDTPLKMECGETVTPLCDIIMINVLARKPREKL